MSRSPIYLIPTVLSESGYHVIPGYVASIVKECEVIFTENLRTTRRYIKQLNHNITIDDIEWFLLESSESTRKNFTDKVKEGKKIGVFSEAGCPGVADPGQDLVAIAHSLEAEVIPLVGPSSILLALMASGMNGQQFCFHGYLPVKEPARGHTIRNLESLSAKNDSTQIFIETPYRNNQLIDALCNTCRSETQLCIAADLTAEGQWIKTKSIAEWKKVKPDLHKRPAIFLLKV